MNRKEYFCVIVLLAILSGIVIFVPTMPATKPAIIEVEKPVPIPTPCWSVFFSPNGGCTDAVVAEVHKAKKWVHAQAYAFTSSTICEALNGAAFRGLEVEVILDDKWNRSNPDSLMGTLVVEVLMDSSHTIAHDKLLILDGTTVITGSFNWTHAAETRNGENLLIVRDPELAAVYERNFQKHKAHSKPWRKP